MKKLIFIENVDQAKYYIANKEKFSNFLPITFCFGPEEIFLKEKINFKTEEDFEKKGIYNGICKSSIDTTEKICNQLNIDYKGINLIPLFYHDIFAIILLSKKYLKLLIEIIKKEKPSEIIVFKKNSSHIEGNHIPDIIQLIFDGKLKIEMYDIPNKKKFNFISAAGFFQRLYSKIRLKYSKKSDNVIFFTGTKIMFNSTIAELLKNKKNNIYRCHNNLQKSFFINGKYIPFYEFSRKLSNSKELKNKISEFENSLKKIKFSEKFNIEPELNIILKKTLQNLANINLLEIATFIDDAINLIQRKKINIVLLDNSVNNFEKAFIEVCNKFGIISIVFQHGIISMKEGAIPMNASFVFVWGKFYRKLFINYGIDEKKVIIIGAPKYDTFKIKNNNIKNKKILYVIDAVNNNRSIPDGHLTKKRQKYILKTLFRVLKRFPEYKLVIKTRSGWEMNSLPGIIAKEENFTNLDIIENADNIELLNDSDLVIIHHSTMGVEGFILKKPIVSFSFKDLDNFNVYKNNSIAKIVYSEKDLEKAIKDIITNNKINNLKGKKIINNELYKLDGKSSKRAADFINKILAKNV